MIELSRYNDHNRDVWDGLVTNSKNGLFIFYRDYLEYHRERFVDHSLIISKKNKVVGIFPANQNEKDIISHGGLTFGSLIICSAMRTIEVLEVFVLIKEYYSSLGFERIIYKAIPSVFHKYAAEEDLYALFVNHAKLFRRDISSVIKLNDRIRFSQTKRQSVMKCYKNDITFVENSEFEEYWELLSSVLKRYNTKPTHSLEEISRLKKLFNDKIRLFEARKDGKLLAGILIYDYDNVVHTQYMANSPEGRKIGVLDFINHKLLTEVFNNREYFSFGISTEYQGTILNKGLIQQKEMMGGRAITIDFYSIDL